MRRRTHCDAARPPRLPGARGGSGVVPERHRVHPHDPRAGPITAQGISDAFRDAELCATALDETFAGRTTFEAAMAAYQQTRDEDVLPVYEFTTQLATLEDPPAEMLQLLAAVHGNQDAMDDFASITAGTVSPVQFFDPANIGRILAASVAPMAM